jgi:hypothetical protein
MINDKYVSPSSRTSTDYDFKIIRPYINEKHCQMSYISWKAHFEECLLNGYNMVYKYCNNNKLNGFLDKMTFDNFTLFMYNNSSKEKQKYL